MNVSLILNGSVRFSLKIKVVYEKRWKPHGLIHGEETNADGMMVYDRRSPPPSFQIPPLEESDGSEFWPTPLLDPIQNLFYKIRLLRFTQFEFMVLRN